MGSAMARSAFDSIYTYFSLRGSNKGIDLVVTGDLGVIGGDVLKEMLSREGVFPPEKHVDCGTLLYDIKRKDAHAGASGCGCSAAVLSGHILPLLRDGVLKNVLALSTGALMSPTSVQQGETIPGVAHLVCFSSEKGGIF